MAPSRLLHWKPQTCCATSHARPDIIEREVLTAESGFDWSRLTSAGSELSLFATQRLLELRIPTGKPGREGSAAIEQFSNRLPEDTVTLVQLPEIDWQGKQTKWFMALEAVATMIEAAPVDREKLPQWLKGRLARQQQTAGSEALEFLADRVEGNLLAAQQEIRKLALLCPPGEISLELLEDSVANVSRFNPFQLVSAIHDAAEKGDSSRIQRMLDGLKAEGEAPPLILWVIANELRMLGAGTWRDPLRPPAASGQAARTGAHRSSPHPCVAVGAAVASGRDRPHD